MKKIIVLCIALCGMIITQGCGKNEGGDAAAQEELTGAWEQYLKIKDALVNSKTAEAADEAKELSGEIARFNTAKLPSDKQSLWKTYSPKFHDAAARLAATGDLAQQRVEFEKLSMVMEEGIRTFGLEGKTIYKLYCPMAFSNKGAAWFSDEKEILNPYFGDEMLHCGEVKETIDF